jgi:SAM-dependent methyltransferase
MHFKNGRQLRGSLFRSSGSEFGDKVFYADNGRRFWVRSIDWLERNQFNWKSDVIDVPPEVLYALLNGGIAPIYGRSDLNRENLTSLDIREIAACELFGTGLEFGAGASPFPIPLNCLSRFADPFTYAELKEALYPGQNAYDLIRPDYVTDIRTLRGISDESVDFIVACHVIEHTNNPIEAIRSCHRALRPGGSLVLVVPDMTKTFDRSRNLTTLEHLIEDYEAPSEERDYGHYLDFYSNAFPLPKGETLEDYAKLQHRKRGDLHYHTFTYESFQGLLAYSGKKDDWNITFQHHTLEGAENIECYFVMTKPVSNH